IGNDIVTASGTTLLGADNKAGLAEIMDFVQFASQNPDFKHGEIRILFTPDEEIGRGVNKVDIKKLNARYGFTVDGESLGSIENETFSADAATVTLHGISSHPGFAKGKMVNSLKVAAAFLEALPKGDLSPETTSGKEGFVHPMQVQGNLEKSEIKFILRDFSTPKLKEQATMLGEIAEQVCKEYPGSSFTLSVTEQYRNMKEVIDLHPTLISNVEEALVRAGITPKLSSIRGGTDGSRLSFMGLPCPNIFAGEHAFHSRQEWVSVQDMQRAVDTLINLAAIFAEKAQN
ncbi:MAG: peptidase T, partial [Saprospiraceae bacterium]